MTDLDVTGLDVLLAVLREENAALERHDFAAAGALLPRKTEAARFLAEAAKRGRRPSAGAAQDLAALADANRRLLEQAVAVQRQVVALVARAASGAGAPAGRYGRTGAPVNAGPGRALLSRV